MGREDRGMNTSGTTTPILVTAQEARMLGAAAAVLERIHDRADRLAFTRGNKPDDPAPLAQHVGRLSESARIAADAAFAAANVATNYGEQPHVLAHFREAERNWNARHPWRQDHAHDGPHFHGHSVRL